jgi:ketosteroid isomerase-like protein
LILANIIRTDREVLMHNDFDRFLEQTRRPAASAFVQGDASGVVAISAREGQATFFDPGGSLTEGAEAINQANLKGAKQFGSQSTTQLDIRDQGASGDLAFWTGYQDAQMDVDGKIQAMKLRVTEVFRKIDGEWRMVHRHASRAAAH